MYTHPIKGLQVGNVQQYGSISDYAAVSQLTLKS